MKKITEEELTIITLDNMLFDKVEKLHLFSNVIMTNDIYHHKLWQKKHAKKRFKSNKFRMLGEMIKKEEKDGCI